MSPRADQYRKLAEEAQQRAHEASEPKTKEMYEKLASGWREMADKIDRPSS
jgi:hypothetical protein